MSENTNRMPDGELSGNSAMRPMNDQGVMTGVTDTYGADLVKGYSSVPAGEICESPEQARMEGN